MTDRAWIGVFLAALCGGPVQAAHPTAVFTLDTQHEILFDAFITPLDKQFTQWAKSCQIGAGGALYVLRCPPAAVNVRSFDGVETPEAVDVTLALFRDLDETIYLAGCLTLKELAEISKGAATRPDERTRRRPSPGEPTERAGAKASRRDCKDLAAGQTFTTEVEDETLRIVVRGRQLDLTIFGVHLRDKPIGTYDEPVRATTAPRIGPLPPVENGMPRTSQPVWQLPDPKAVVRAARLKGTRGALSTGRLVLTCADAGSPVSIDEADVGLCPIAMPLIAGAHVVSVRGKQGGEWRRDIKIARGQTVELRAPASRR